MNLLCPLSSRPAKSSPPAPWLKETLHCHGRELRTAERRWRKSHVDSDLSSYKSLLSKFSLLQQSASPFPLFPFLQPMCIPQHPTLTSFSLLSSDEIFQLLTSSNPTTYPLDPIPSALFQTIARNLLPFISSSTTPYLLDTCLLHSKPRGGGYQSSRRPHWTAPALTIDRYHFSLSSQKTLNEQSLCLTLKQLHDPNQSGYKPAHSTEMALITVTETHHAAKAAKQSSVLILLDLSAAFDTVNHNILLSVLSRLGVTSSPWRWFQSYLNGRSYQVSRRISACLTDTASWMTANHLKLNPCKTELLFIPGFDPFSCRKLPSQKWTSPFIRGQWSKPDPYLEYFEPQVWLGLKYLASALMDDKHRDYFLSWFQD
ncbi:hypothetical protein P4O66_015310, partial [Electrophorus voltai]